MAGFDVSYIYQIIDKYSGPLRRISGQTARFKKKVKETSQKLKEISLKLRDVGKSASMYLTLPFAALSNSAVRAATDAQEIRNAYGETFKGLEKESAKAVETLRKNFDLATASAQELLNEVGAQLVSLGMSREEALKLAEASVQLSTDVASFRNIQGGAQRATKALTKALINEREMLKMSFKIALREEDVKERAAKLMAKNTKLSEKAARAQATLQLVTERSSDAIGDYARTRSAAANRERQLAEQYRQTSVELGKIMLPLYAKLLKALTVVLRVFDELSPSTKKVLLILGGVAAAAGPLLIVLGGLAMVLPVVLAGLKILAVTLGILMSPISLIALAVAGLIYLFIKFRKPIMELAATIKDNILNAFTKLKMKVTSVFNTILDYYYKIKNAITSAGNWFTGLFSGGDVSLSAEERRINQTGVSGSITVGATGGATVENASFKANDMPLGANLAGAQ